MKEGRAGGRAFFAQDALPHAHEHVPFPGHLLQGFAPTGGAGNEPAFAGFQFFQEGLDALALGLVGDAAGNPQLHQGGHIDQVMTGQADVGGQAGAFVGRRAAQHLDQQVLALMEQVGDGRGWEPAAGWGLVYLVLEPKLEEFIFLGRDIFGKEIGGAVRAHIHKGRGHAGQKLDHPALIDVAHGAVLGPAFHIEFGQAAVFEESHPGVACGDAD